MRFGTFIMVSHSTAQCATSGVALLIIAYWCTTTRSWTRVYSTLWFMTKFSALTTIWSEFWRMWQWQRLVRSNKVHCINNNVVELHLNVYLILHAQSGYIKVFILKWLRQKPNLGNCDYFAKVIHDTRSRPKCVWTLKWPWSFKVQLWTEILYDPIKSNHTVFLYGLSNSLFWSSALQIISNNISVSEEGYPPPHFEHACHKQFKRASLQIYCLSLD